MVASRLNNQIESLARNVLIPFIAGQWSLHAALLAALDLYRPVLIPFIAGQWSLRRRNADDADDADES